MNLEDMLVHLVSSGGSDLHLKAGSAPRIRVTGRLEAAPFDAPSTDDLAALADDLLGPDGLEELLEAGHADVAHSVPELGRFRVNAYRQRGSVAFAVRRVVPGIPALADLGLPPAVHRFAEEEQGLVVVAGPAGAGTTTTAGALVDAINSNRAVHIATVEDPIEVLHADKEAIVSQREVGTDAPSMADAVDQCLRQDPDVIFIGSLVDAETIRAALGAAETGKLVLAVMRTASAVETIDRLVQSFDLADQRQVRVTLGRTLRGVLCQRLLDRADGAGRVAAAEVFVGTVKSLEFVKDPDRTGDLRQVLADGRYSGMQTFDQSLLELHRDGLVTLEEAMSVADDEADFRINVERGGYG